MSAAAWLDAASWVLLGAGVFFCVVGAFGIVRFPDFYTRCHAAGITDTFGAVFVLAGLALQGGFSQAVTLKLVLVCAFLLFASPVNAHALVKAAHAHGVSAPQPVPDRPSDYPGETANPSRPQER